MTIPEDDPTFDADLAAFNEKALGGDDPQDDAPIAAPDPAAADKADKGGEPDPSAASDKEDESKGDDPAPEADETAAEPAGLIEITNDLPLETFRERRTQVFDLFDEVPPEVQQVVDYYEHQLEAGTGSAAVDPVFEDLGGVDRVKKIVEPFEKLYDGANVEGSAGREVLQPNAKPVVEMLRTDFRNEAPAIAFELLASDSNKYRGASILQELMIDIWGCTPQQTLAVANFLEHKTPLPVVDKTKLPAGLDEKLGEAYLEMPERKRFEFEELAKEIAQIEAELPGLDEYYKATSQTKLTDLKGKFDDEITTLRRIQAGIDATRAETERNDRQTQADAERFGEELGTEYLGELDGLVEMFAKDLAPKLDFVDPSAQGTVANSIVARFAAALSFLYNPVTFEYVPDPTTAIYRKQLKAEGIKGDFEAGSKLLFDHLLALRRVKVAKRTNASPEAIGKAERDLKNILRRIKAEVYTPLVGQVGTMLVDSAGKALEKKVGEVAKKKQFSRKVNTGFGTGGQRNTEDTLDDEIKRNNEKARREANESGTGSYDDELFGRDN